MLSMSNDGRYPTFELTPQQRRQKTLEATHHDALEFPDGTIVLLTLLEVGQQATVLQLPVTHEGASVPLPKEAKV
jgi:hypothetical protein